MAGSAEDWSEAVFSSTNGLDAVVADPSAAALVWSIDGARLLWSSPGAAALVPMLVGPDRMLPRLPLAGRLRALGDGLAPPEGFRLERVRVRSGEPLTFACRMLSRDGDRGLLTIVVDRKAPAGSGERPPAKVPGRAKPGDGGLHAAADRADQARRPLPRRGTRFVWQTDREGRIAFVSPELAAAVGERGAAILGRTWQELEGRRLLAPRPVFHRRLASGEAWNRVRVLWNDPERGTLVPVELSGQGVAAGPDATSGGGSRGFGIAFPDEAVEAPVPPLPDLPDMPTWDERVVPAGQPDPPSTGVPRPGRPDGLDEAIQAAAELTGTAGDTVFNVLRAWFSSSLGDGPSGRAAASSQAVTGGRVDDGDLPGPEAASGLSRTEQGALHEIARALSAEGGLPEPRRGPAEIITLPPPRPREPDPARLLDAIPIPILAVRDGTPFFANRAFLDTVEGGDLPSLVASGALHDLIGAVQAASSRQSPLRVALPGPGGREIPAQASTSSLPWGELPATLVVLTLVAEGRPGEAETRALTLELSARDGRLSELSAALDGTADGVAILDRSARIRWLSRGAERTFGVTANEVVGDSVTALLVPESHPEILAALAELGRSAEGTTVAVEARTRPGAAGARPLSVRIGRMKGGEAAYSAAFHDVSRVHALEKELREARRAAEQASANQADFLARISHEIRTPLTAITGFSELMLAERFGPLGSERYKGYLRDIQESGGHVVSLVNDLLDLAKATSGHSDLAIIPVDLNAAAQTCVALSGPLAARERIILRASFGTNIPRIAADERAIRQIILNVLSNAIRYTGAGGQVIVSTNAGSHGDVVLSVRDTGPGMTDDEIGAALTPFRQVASTRRGDGTGLGLPLSKALVEAIGGRFSITSARASGTLVELRFPAAADRMAAE